MTSHLSRLSLFAAIIILGHAPSAIAGEGKTLVELFTSQGCSSCPPADELMGELAKRDDLIALSLPVDYWDFLGWKDTMASPANSARQRAYARERGDSQVYTPQMVVNGKVHVVGSHGAAVETAIQTAAATPLDLSVDVMIGETEDSVTVDITGTNIANSDADAATVWFVLYTKTAAVNIGRGENSGRKVTYYNVVREMMPIGMWHGAPATFELPKNDLAANDDLGCAVLVQLHGTGTILGVASLDAITIAGR